MSYHSIRQARPASVSYLKGRRAGRILLAPFTLDSSPALRISSEQEPTPPHRVEVPWTILSRQTRGRSHAGARLSVDPFSAAHPWPESPGWLSLPSPPAHSPNPSLRSLQTANSFRTIPTSSRIPRSISFSASPLPSSHRPTASMKPGWAGWSAPTPIITASGKSRANPRRGTFPAPSSRKCRVSPS